MKEAAAQWADVLAAVNKLLAAHSLAAVRLLGWDHAAGQALFEVFHCEWPTTTFGQFRFLEVSYLQCPIETPWGFRIRLVAQAALPSRHTLDSEDLIFELYAPDGQEPSAFIVASGLEVVLRSNS